MFCGKCGNKINAGEKFCSYCGNQMETGEFAQTQVNASNLIKTNEKRTLLVPIIIGSVGILLAIICQMASTLTIYFAGNFLVVCGMT